MKRVRAIIPVLLMAAIGAATPVAAQQAPRAGTPRPDQGPQPAVAPQAASAVEYAETTDFKTQIFEVKHRDPNDLVSVLRPLGSGFRGTAISASREFGTISVRDFPENLATIEAAIKRLDVAEVPRPSVELHMHVLVASNAGTSSELPPEIRGAVAQLRSTLNYSSFTLLAPLMIRSRTGSDTNFGRGEVQLPPGLAPGNGGQANYEYQFRIASSSPDQAVDLNRFNFEFNSSLGHAQLASDLSIKPGEQVVVGTASLRGEALVLILSAAPVK